MNQQELVELFGKEVHDRHKEVDPHSREDWFSLTLGWALAKGLPPAKAIDFARHVRYQTELG